MIVELLTNPTDRSRRERCSLLGTLALLILVLAGSFQRAVAQTLPAGFASQVVFGGLTEPTTVRFAADGRVFVAEKGGLIKVFPSLSSTTPMVFANLTPNVYSAGSSGLLAMALDPGFPVVPYVYVFYTYAGAAGAATSSCPAAADSACVRSARLSRLVANGNSWTEAETVLVADWYQRYPGQSVGDLVFGSDGMLYASAGDGASSTGVDVGQGDVPSPDPANEGGALRSQDLRTPSDPVTLSGTVIRVDPATGLPRSRTTSMQVGSPTVDASGVRSYSVTSAYQGPTPTVVRVLEPTAPAPGLPRRLLYVLPVESGVTSTASTFSDGLEELRLLDIPNRYNVTLIAPSFNIEPWYGDHDTNLDRRLESFIVKDLVPFGDGFSTPGQIPQRWVLGFSKSGTGALSLILRNPNIFSAAAAWDAPAQFTDMSAFPGMAANFGSEQNFDRYEIPSLVVTSAAAFRSLNRLWISGDASAWTSHMAQLDGQMTQSGVLHTFVQGVTRAHSWSSGWLDGAVTSLASNATAAPPTDINADRVIAYGLRKPARLAVRPGTKELWLTDAGWNDAEEINRIADTSDGAVENFGWPCIEGVAANAYTNAAIPLCADILALAGETVPPMFAYRPDQQVIPGEACGTATGEIGALTFYAGGSYPATYHGALFFSDVARGCIWVVPPDSGGVPAAASRQPFLVGAGAPSDLRAGPGGDLFYVDRFYGTVVRISYAPPPTDTTPPVRSDGAPNGTVTAGTAQVTLSLTTDEAATCRYGLAAGTAYAALPSGFSGTGGTSHSTTFSSLTNGTSYTLYVRCSDLTGNANTTDFPITFAVSPAGIPGLVAAYGFNEGTGTTTSDSSGNGLTGTASGAAWSTAGRFGGALTFNGTSDWVTVAASNALNLTTGMTIEAWVFPTATTGVRDVLVKEGSTVDIYNLYARNWRGLPESNVFVGGSNKEAEGTSLPASTWTHLAGTYDGTALRYYANGVLQGTVATAGPISTSSGPLRIGGNSLWGEYFQGRIDEVRIYNRALSAAEIQVDMTTAVLSPNPGSPSVSMTSPLDNATVAGLTALTASASDDVGVVGVQFLLDGNLLGTEMAAAPYTLAWDSSSTSTGSHTLAARARDGNGNMTISGGVTVNVVNNSVPGGFHDEVVIGGGLTYPTAFEFLPDGRMLITEFQGRIMVVQPGATTVDATPVIQLPNVIAEDVTAGGERGLTNVVADPDFPNNGFIYVFYTAATPQRDRVSRFTMVGNTANASSELVIWQGVADSTGTDHHGGGLAFGPDGKLYISTGDNGASTTVQSLTSDHGKMLRVNKDGSVPTDNPFYDGAGTNIDAIWARGLRNPYRFSFDTATGRMIIGDVGFNTTEEVNVGTAGANYGWPTCEGPCSTAGMTNPVFSYPHAGHDAAVTGGFVYHGSQFPAEYQGVYFYGDFARNVIRYLTISASGVVTGDFDFLPPDGALDGPFDPVMLKQGPDGSLYYVDFGWGWLSSPNPASIRRIRYYSGNQPPVVMATATPSSGLAPLAVSFSTSGSYDPENQPLAYSWSFGDGVTSSAANPVHTYTASGAYAAQVTVSDGSASTTSAAIPIAVGNAPQVTVTSPTGGFVFRAGDVITFGATATDFEDGPLPASSFSWTILFHHDSHVHPTLGPLSGLTGGTFTIPRSGHDFSGNTSYEIIVTVTDSAGLQTTKSVTVLPKKISITFGTNPSGLPLIIDGVTTATPYVKDTLTGFQHVVEAANTTVGVNNYGFVSWSDGGAQTHTITAGETASSLTAVYLATTTTAFPATAAVITGTLSSGTAAALATDNNVYYVVASTTTGTRTAAWYGGFVGVPKALTSLKVNYRGKNSRSCTQTVALMNWASNSWVQLDSRAVSTTEVAITSLVPPGILANYVSGTASSGEVRVRVQCQANANLTSSGDVMSLVYDAPVGPPPPDTVPPVRTGGSPTGTLVAGTIQAAITLTTDEAATCRYGPTPGTPFSSLPNGFVTTGGTSHSTVVTGLTDGSTYSYYVKCQDAAGNANTDDTNILFTIATPDTIPPTRTNGTPTGTLATGTTQATLALTTNEAATCRYGVTSGTAYASLPGVFATTGGTSQSTAITGLTNGTTYSYYVKCQDAAGNANTDDFAIGFTVAQPPPDVAPPVRSNGTPVGTLAAGTTQAPMTLVTSEAATCRFGPTAGTAYSAQPNMFTTTGGTTQSTMVAGLVNGGTYSYFVRCQDALGNTNADDFPISFTVAPSMGAGLVAAYGFNAGAGTTVLDSSGNALTGTITGATWSTAGKFGGALSFNGTSNLVTVAAAGALNLTSGMTLEAWVFPTTASGTRDVIIKEGPSVDIYNLYARNWRGLPEANAYISGVNRTAEGTVLAANVWTHLAATFDGTTVRLFVNGVVASTTTMAGAITTSTGPLRIGGNTLWGEYFQGRIDEVRIYNRALAQTEIQSDMTIPLP